MHAHKSIGVAALALAAGTTLVFTGTADAASRKGDDKDPIYRLREHRPHRPQEDRQVLQLVLPPSRVGHRVTLVQPRLPHRVAMDDANVPTDKWTGKGCIHVVNWPHWRRHHQAIARQCHYRRRTSSGHEI
ncbi:hypothetical protein [Streptomyces sp. NPDC005890]|uniref:hypothetical protein n=1 Tax=Streptomyces sp. NPDC005890 TaxID=3154568 RepID=UPI0033E14BC6